MPRASRPSRLRAAAAIAVAMLAPVAPAAAQQAVDLALVLAVDVSRSMDYGEQQIQRDGYVAAFRNKEVQDAIGSGFRGRIAVTYMEWAGAFYQEVLVPWQVISTPEEASAFADRLAAAPITAEMWTSISGGLQAAAHALSLNPFAADRQTIDVSGDGHNNNGTPVVPTRDDLVRRGITINGLPLMLRPNGGGQAANTPLDIYYEDCVIGGPGAFVIAVRDPSEFETAIRRKLILEIASVPAAVVPVAEIYRPEPRVDCLAGERARGLDPFFFGPVP
jgi:hypothetical protein